MNCTGWGDWKYFSNHVTGFKSRKLRKDKRKRAKLIGNHLNVLMSLLLFKLFCIRKMFTH